MAFNPWKFIFDIAAVSRTDGRRPDPDTGVGRECYAFSAQEDAAHEVALRAAGEILADRVNGRDYRICRDPVGNVYIHYFGTGRSLRPFVMCSHLDSVQNGGMFDGVAGVSLGLSVLERTVRSKRAKRGFKVVIYRSEESSPRNGVGCLGSAIATGTIDVQKLERVVYDGERPLRELFARDRWESMRDLCTSPVVSPMSMHGSLEVHIEQSKVIAQSGARVGIVTPGIGGAWRHALAPCGIATVRASANDCTVVRLEFRGVADHTGGTPPNPAFYAVGDASRKDALVAASYLVKEMMRDDHVRLLRCEPERNTGFTSIPARQIAELLVPERSLRDLMSRLDTHRSQCERRFGVTVAVYTRRHEGGGVDVVVNSSARRLLNTPAYVASLSGKALRREGGLGTTRATIVDYHLSSRGLEYKLDGREVDNIDSERLEQAVLGRFARTLGDRSLVREVSRKRSQPVDARLVEELRTSARERDISFVELPSLPGHDSDRHAEAGIPVCMLFLRQNDGVSHSPYEWLEEDDLLAGRVVAEDFVAKMLSQ